MRPAGRPAKDLRLLLLLLMMMMKNITINIFINSTTTLKPFVNTTVKGAVGVGGINAPLQGGD